MSINVDIIGKKFLIHWMYPNPNAPLSVRFLAEMKTLISLNAYIDVYPYPYVVPLSERFLAELRCTDKGTPSVPNLFHQVVTTNANVNYICIYYL